MGFESLDKAFNEGQSECWCIVSLSPQPHIPCQPMQAVASISPMWLSKLAMTRSNGKESGIYKIHRKTVDLQHETHWMLATI
jgi:hypothetical protein